MEIADLPVTIVVKAPNQKIADQTVECEAGWDVKQLKRHLSAVYPSSPGESQQKIIYSGRLLEDNLVLRDVLRQYEPNQTRHIVHLVCNGKMDDPSSSSVNSDSLSNNSASNSEFRHRNVHSSNPSNHGNGNNSTSTTTTSEHSTDPSQNFVGAPPHTAAGNMFGAGPALGGMMGGMQYMPPIPGMMYTPEQIMWMQQMYAQQLAQYMQYYGPQTPGMAEAPLPGDTDPHPAGRPEDPPARPRPAGQQPIRMNAQGGAWIDDDDDEDGGNRDWLDWVYTLSRFSVLLSIVYFYSTVSRFILVFGFFALVYLYQGGWFRARRAQAQQEPEEPAQEDAQAQPEPEPEPGQAEPEAEGDATSTEESTGEENAEPAVPPPPGTLAVAWSFFSTFFTSLVPQQPAAVNAN